MNDELLQKRHLLNDREESLNRREESLNERERLLNKLDKQLEDYEEQIAESEKEISDTAYRKGYTVGILGLTKQLMGLFSEARVEEYGEDIPVLAVRTFILAYCAGLIGSSHEDDIDELGNTFNDKMEDIIKEVEKTL